MHLTWIQKTVTVKGSTSTCAATDDEDDGHEREEDDADTDADAELPTATTSSTASRSPDLADDPAKLLAARLAGNLLVETPQPCRRRRSRASSYRKSPSRRPCSLPRRQDDAAELKPLPGATTTSTTKQGRSQEFVFFSLLGGTTMLIYIKI